MIAPGYTWTGRVRCGLRRRGSEVGQRSGRHRYTDGVEHGGEVDDFLRNGSGYGRQISESGGGHADHAQSHSADGGFKGNAPHVPCDVDEFVDSSLERFPG